MDPRIRIRTTMSWKYLVNMIGATDRGREADPAEPGAAEAEQHRTRPYHGHSAPEEGQAAQVSPPPTPIHGPNIYKDTKP